MKKLVFVITLCFSFSFVIFAQKEKTAIGFTNLQHTYEFATINYSDLNTSLSEYNFSELPNSAMGMGLNLEFWKKRFCISAGIGIQGRYGMDDSGLSWSLGYKLTNNFKYVFYDSERLKILSDIGIGFLNQYIFIQSYPNDINTFNQSMESSRKGIDLSAITYYTEAAIGVNYRFNKPVNREIGFKLGYRLQLYQTDWYFGNNALNDMPEISHNGLYFSIAIPFVAYSKS